MNKSRIVSAIDIGSFKITTLIAQVNTDQVTFEDSVSVVGVSSNPSKGVKKGQIVDIEQAVESIIVSVEAAERMAGYNLDHAFVSIGGGHISSRNSTGVVAVSDPEGEVSPDDVERVIDAAKAISHPDNREIIHVLPREYIVDGESGVRDPIGMSGVRLEVETHLITASSAALKNLTKAVKEVGINIDDLVFTGLASSYSTLTPTEKELGCVLVDIGGETTSIAVFVDNAVAYSGTIPIGARNVTSDLAIGLRVSLESAEKIKIGLSKKKKGVQKPADKIDIAELGAKESKKVSRRTITEGIIRPRLNEIFSMVRIDLEKAGLINRVPSGAVLTGGGALTIGAEDSAKRMLSLPVRIGKPGGVSGLIDDIIDPAFATSIGLLLYGVENSSAEVSSGLSFAKNFKLPGKGLLDKLADTVKDLLP